MEQLKARQPATKILLTFFSPSGYEVRKHYAGADVVCYLPFDTPARVRDFIRLARPSLAIFIKYEFWANYLFELKRQQIPVISISSIFRDSQWFFKSYGRFFLNGIRCFNHLFVQDEHSKALLASHGIRCVSVAGDTRFDRVLDVKRQAQPLPAVEAFAGRTEALRQHILVAGSTWPADEAIIIPWFNAHPEAKLIIAPHEISPARLQELSTRLSRPSIRLSEADAEQIADKDCLIIDSFGLLSSIYRYGDIAYIGGGFGKGIHNILEAAVYGIPVLFGPHYHKFKEAKDILAQGGGFCVSSAEAFDAQISDFLSYAQLLQSAAESAAAYVHSRAGATAQIMETIAK
jgi:3-deoxy-D-manno-octulosonic-acid transferase